ncbi:MAG: ATP phosphoribosyltransferase [Alphaproteobacteria bacterium]|nr:ATP phosphoribosyltransferase [Alphaproteobacteria bacterium]
MSQLILAIPSKGRLEEASAEIFAKAGLALKRDGARGYRGSLPGLPDVQVDYVSAGDIAARLAEGSLHMGITGEDLLREEIPDMESAVQLCLPLGFGHADVVVAIPNGWVDVTTMFDLADVAAEFRTRHGRRLRVATKYTNLTADFFARHSVADFELVASFGATEAAPNSGAAEAIVDITSTGATLTANDLRVPEDGVILKSQANLAAALKADWSPQARTAAKRILAQISAMQAGEQMMQLAFTAPAPPEQLLDLDAALIHSVTPSGGAYSCSLVVPRSDFGDLRNALGQRGIAVIADTPKFIFAPDNNRAFERLSGALG